MPDFVTFADMTEITEFELTDILAIQRPSGVVYDWGHIAISQAAAWLAGQSRTLAHVTGDCLIAVTGDYMEAEYSASQRYGFMYKMHTPAQNMEFGCPVILQKGFTFNIRVNAVKANDSGIVTARLNGVSLGSWDLYAAGTTYNFSMSVDNYEATAQGYNVLKFKVESKNASSSGYQARITDVRFLPVAL